MPQEKKDNTIKSFFTGVALTAFAATMVGYETHTRDEETYKEVGDKTRVVENDTLYTQQGEIAAIKSDTTYVMSSAEYKKLRP